MPHSEINDSEQVPYLRPPRRPFRIGCVSYLNSKPLIDPLVDRPDVSVTFAVPARLLPLLEAGEVDAALLPIVDFQRSPMPLALVPVGAIGSDGPTYTVRIFSATEPAAITTLFADTDSHTSVILAQVILRKVYGARPRVVAYRADNAAMPDPLAGAYLYIGDKVVTGSPPADLFPHQVDLGEAWKSATGLPFTFAMWMMPREKADANLIALLAEAQRIGAGQTEALVDKYAAAMRWPPELARRYFTEFLRYTVTDRSRAGIDLFFSLAATFGLLQTRRPVEYID